MKFDRKTFFAMHRRAFGSLNQEQVDALEFLLSSFEKDATWKDVRHIAYALATIKHETAQTYKPIKEYRSRIGSKGRANQDRYWLSGFYGRGYVQITWKKNYEKFGIADTPEKALEPETAFWILTAGMHRGLFTGKKLSDFIKGSTTDYRNARKIINGLDKADMLAGYARTFEKLLRVSSTSSAAPAETPSEKPDIGVPAEEQGVTSETANQPPIHVDKIEEVKIDATPPPSTEPVVVTVERVSVWAKIGAGFAAVSGLGIGLGEVITGKLNALEPMHLLYVFGAVLLIAMALFFYDRAQKRAHEKTLKKMDSAADPGKNTVELTRAKQ